MRTESGQKDFCPCAVRRVCTLLATLLLLLSHRVFPQTHIPPGNVHGRWSKQDSPYVVDGDIQIPHGKTLKIEPGVRIVFSGHFMLAVQGVLLANGVQGDSIYFIPRDTTVGWKGIRFLRSESGSVLQYCVVSGGRPSPGLPTVAEPDTTVMRFPPGDALDGGGIFVARSDPTLLHSLIVDNVAEKDGGGLAMNYDSRPVLRFCRIAHNCSRVATGGGVLIAHSRPMLSQCTIAGNYASNLGGGVFSANYSSPVIDSCLILDNIARNRGGGICFYTNAKPILRNSVVTGNRSSIGGGIYIDEFYNVYRDERGKIDVQIENVRIEGNTADYGGGLWFRDVIGELRNATICRNRARIGGGVCIEHNPRSTMFSQSHLCSVYLNFAWLMGNDFFRVGGDSPLVIALDTFTVKHVTPVNAEPLEKLILRIRNSKIEQVKADLYVGPDGDDSHSGLTKSEPLRTLKMAFLKILADSTSPHTIYLKKGNYVFSETNDLLALGKLKYVSLDGLGLTDVIIGPDRITVFTPWWISVWALLACAAILTTGIATAWSLRMRRLRMVHALEKERFEAHKIEEIDELKTQFFTNISHEFRTPLTLILGPARELMQHSRDENTRDEAGLIHRSAQRLARMVDELLDIQKIEAGEMKLRASPCNLGTIVREAALPFCTVAERRRMKLTVRSDEQEIIAYVDREKFDKIIANVLSNAFKFTPEGGAVTVSVHPRKDVQFLPASLNQPGQAGNVPTNDGCAEIAVTDTGIGIPRTELEKIFDRFYQVGSVHTKEHEGTGIGLALTKELTELHHGRIEVESEEGKGSTFRILLPLGRRHLKPEEMCEETAAPLPGAEGREPGPVEFQETSRNHTHRGDGIRRSRLLSLLVVEDNADVRKYLHTILDPAYEISEAGNGEDGLKEAFEEIPDLIILDIMLPKLDGIKVCQTLKADSRTSHIPVLMLTAKATIQDKIQGFETGADAYIMKPFEPEELKARIRNLIEQRKRIHEHFREHGLFELDGANIASIDQKFMEKAAQVMRVNMSDATFGVEAFAEEMGVSRSLLLKKMQALVGVSPADLIKRTRLKRAAELLAGRGGNVSEVALEVGFSNPAYFAECFRKEFGCPPSQYHR